MSAKAKALRRVFLSARWQLLAMLNWQVEPALLEPYVPRGVELDFHQGRTFVSLVGFLFLDTRVLGFSIPGHANFEEVNLRFYVRRQVAGEVRRGVAFIKEFVPRWAIAQTARVCYNEPYVALPMRHEVTGEAVFCKAPSMDRGQQEPGARVQESGARSQEPGRVAYRWWIGGRWESLELAYAGERLPLVAGSHEEFIAEHYWGYCGQRRGGCVEYEVAHPAWSIWPATQAQLDCRSAPALYGAALAEVLSRPPSTAFLADGSPVAVMRPRRICQ
jgi:uncharacterized protein YqjF (DUF2071 family)